MWSARCCWRCQMTWDRRPQTIISCGSSASWSTSLSEWQGQFIIVTSHRGISDHWLLCCLFANLKADCKENINALQYWPLLMGIQQSPVDSPHKGPVIWIYHHVLSSLCHTGPAVHNNLKCCHNFLCMTHFWMYGHVILCGISVSMYPQFCSWIYTWL